MFDVIRLIFSVVLILLPNLVSGSDCDNWFQKIRVLPGPDCLMKCAAAPVDMGTFQCNGRCEEFCQLPIGQKFILKISELYPGLTEDERKLSSKEPKMMLKAYQLSWKAQQICEKEYFNSRTNDESDACRHFIWAALLTHEIGADFAEQVLNAHEQDPKQPGSEKAMDLANNRLGVLAAERLKKRSLLNDGMMLESFKEHLRKGDLIVITERQKK